ncbi:MAG: class I SAM-dependent methyltransferase [Candidatus Bathyarchaeota archaeon]|nr:MAG: class I SAM-dependent methyltransferase [Candidatus Bathyarchaeota archaeon]
MILDVGCGFLSSHKKRGEIGIDLARGKADLLADAQKLPFRKASFDKIYVMHILEHLANPFQSLKEIKRVAKKGADIIIDIPVVVHPCKDELLNILSFFPFRLVLSIKRLLRWRRYRYTRGFWHISKIEPCHCERQLSVVEISKVYERLHPFLWKLLPDYVRSPRPSVWRIQARPQPPCESERFMHTSQ